MGQWVGQQVSEDLTGVWMWQCTWRHPGAGALPSRSPPPGLRGCRRPLKASKEVLSIYMNININLSILYLRVLKAPPVCCTITHHPRAHSPAKPFLDAERGQGPLS